MPSETDLQPLLDEVTERTDARWNLVGGKFHHLEGRVIEPVLEEAEAPLKGFWTAVFLGRDDTGPFLAILPSNLMRTADSKLSEARKVYVLRDLGTGYLHLSVPFLPVETDDLHVPLRDSLTDEHAQAMKEELREAVLTVFTRLYGSDNMHDRSGA